VKEGADADAARKKVEAFVVLFNILARSISIRALPDVERVQHYLHIFSPVFE